MNSSKNIISLKYVGGLHSLHMYIMYMSMCMYTYIGPAYITLRKQIVKKTDLRTGRAALPRNIIFLIFLVLISVSG
jgi:hypothetical protein